MRASVYRRHADEWLSGDKVPRWESIQCAIPLTYSRRASKYLRCLCLPFIPRVFLLLPCPHLLRRYHIDVLITIAIMSNLPSEPEFEQAYNG